MTDPAVSVLLATRNGERYLRQALESMVAQTFTDWEWVLVDDGSTDGTSAILEEYRQRFPDRVRVLRHETSLGLAASLNHGLDEARAELIARMDDDDVAHPERLALQVASFRRDPCLLLLGTSGYCIDEDTGLAGEYMPAYDFLRLRVVLCWHNPFLHASVMFRARDPQGQFVRYDESYPAAQDYELWTRLARLGRVAVLPEKLMTYRRRRGSVTGTRRTVQQEAAHRVSESYTRGFTLHTSLAGMTPDDIRKLVDDPLSPDASRIRQVTRVFAAAARLPQGHKKALRRAMMSWAVLFLECQTKLDLFCSPSRHLFRSCGREGFRYLLRRAGRMT